MGWLEKKTKGCSAKRSEARGMNLRDRRLVLLGPKGFRMRVLLSIGVLKGPL